MEEFNSPIQGYDGWNVNRSYMTPSYMSNFRPEYHGANNRGNPYARNTSIGTSIWRQGPGDFEYGQDVLGESAADRYNIAMGAGDATAVALQHVAIPAAAWYGASRLGGEAFGKMAGSRLGGGIAARVGMRATGAAIGGFTGAMMAPILAAQAIGTMADRNLIDPYVQTRRGMDAMMSNTANTAIMGEAANKSGGFGMSASRAQEISQALTVAGQKDIMFDGGDYNEIADNMMRAGIFQEVGDMDSNKVVDGVKKATSVLKMIQRITGDPDIKSGIQTLAKLKSGGLDDINQMGLAVNQLRNASATSGVSMEQLLNTIGNQGSVMAQQNGISATTGLLASSDAFAGFTNARRAGLISGTESAMLGGTEGMTQNLMGGAYQALNSGAARMIMQGGSNFGDTLSDTIGRWGARVSGNPLHSMGDYFMNQQVYKDAAMKNVGASNITIKSLQGLARSMNMDPNDDEVLASLAPTIGLSSEQFRSAALADRAAQDPRSYSAQQQARRASNMSDRTTEMQNENRSLEGIPILGSGQKLYNEVTKGVAGVGASVMDAFTAVPAAIADNLSGMLSEARGFEPVADQSYYIGKTEGHTGEAVKYVGTELEGSNSIIGHGVKGRGTRVETDRYDKLFSTLNNLERSNNKDHREKANAIRKAISSNNPEEASRLINELDNDTKGMLTGFKKDDFRRTNAQSDIEKALARGDISTKVTSDDTLESVEKTAKGEMFLLSSKSQSEREDALVDLIDKNFDKMREYAGVPKSTTDTMSLKDRKAAIFNALKNKDVKYDEIDNIDTGWKGLAWRASDSDANWKELRKRMNTLGVSSDDLSNYMGAKGIDKEALLKPFQNMIGNDSTKATKALLDEINKNKDVASRDAQTRATSVDWDNIRDVTTGLSSLGKATAENTAAMNLNTDALLAINNQNNGWKDDITRSGLLKSNPKDTVVKPVKSSTDAPVYRG